MTARHAQSWARLFGLTVCAALFAGTAYARDPYMVLTGPGVVAFFDRDTETRIKSVVEVWVDYYVLAPSGRAYMQLKAQQQYDCRKDQTRSMYGIKYAPSGKVLTSGEMEQKWQPVAPGTVAVIHHAYVCGSSDYRTKVGFRVVPGDEPAWAQRALDDLEDGTIDGK